MDFLKRWTKNNIFNFRKGDSCAYLVLYIVLPILITCLSIKYPADNIGVVYCYLTIFVSAVNGIYDAANRWIGKCFKNVKLFFVILGCAGVCVYSTYVILSLLITNDVTKYDGFLFIYVLVLIIALPDVIACFVIDMAYKDCVDSGRREGVSNES